MEPQVIQDSYKQISMLNAGSILGRVIPNALADRYGHLNVITPVALICGSLIFVFFGLEDVGGVLVFSLLYGFFSGGCKCITCSDKLPGLRPGSLGPAQLSHCYLLPSLRLRVIWMSLGTFNDATQALTMLKLASYSIRMGIGYFLCAFALLGGEPIDGALLNPGLHWTKPILFSGVSLFHRF